MARTIEMIGGPLDGRVIPWYAPHKDDGFSTSKNAMIRYQVPGYPVSVYVDSAAVVTHRWRRIGDRLVYEGVSYG